MKRQDIQKLRGEDLFYYFTHEHPDENYRSVVALLPYALMDMEKACDLIEKCVRENKTLITVYPGIENMDTSDMEYIGDIMDGGLYVSDEPYFKERMYLIDDRHEYFSYGSKCAQCQHFDMVGMACKAFPNGIPVKYLSGDAEHTKIDPEQKGNTVFISKI
ncbi:hypothetical protein [Proteiniphilum acetatigenes]|uniref:hypothetical protein n=1 Tax=Proteiniphilum acetatigenes TaxID=294710 RepID=UPI000365A349|nr:hypothetical protein [Proteiniphilum acetatigenes]